MIKMPIKKRKQYLSLNNDYFIFVVVIICSILLIATVFYFVAYNAYTTNRDYELRKSADFLESEMTDIFKENSNILKFIGQGVLEVTTPEEISKILLDAGELDISSMTKSYVSWANPEGKIIVSGKTGILTDNFPDISSRSYYVPAINKPWALHVAIPATSLFSSSEVLPTVMGIADKEKKLKGFLVLGLRMSHVVNHLERMKGLLKTSYMILDSNHHILIKSSDNDSKITDELQNERFFEIQNDFQVREGKLLSSFKIGDIDYIRYKKMVGFPYVILVGLNQQALDKEFYFDILPKLAELLFIGAFSIAIVCIFRHRIVKPITELASYAFQISHGKTNIRLRKQKMVELRTLAGALLQVVRYIRKNERYKKRLEEAKTIADNSDNLRQEFINSLNKKLEYPIDIILNYTKIIMQNFTGELDIKANNDQLVRYLKNIYEAAVSLKSKAINELNLTYFDINRIIDESVQINLKLANHNDIITNYNVDAKSPSIIYADELLIKQVFVSLIRYSIKNSPMKSKIEIFLTSIFKNGTSYVHICIKYNGFGLSKDQITKIRHKVATSPIDNNIDVTEINFNLIKEIVSLHHGIFEEQSKGYGSNIFTIILPILTENSNFTESKDHDQNVEYLSNFVK